ncbi:tripartite motif-containing protein 66-like isoform X1 [Dreissena polymorpha]|uniref:tripartite motif-containing protein 66-like isoform X1 n=1 Tax=Dreissena polymorpha TaxID=45954 RepID=UPI002264FCA4|nr:tripartite motif-containing protein 66-like isoform X1 [Dreissena polymorpha]
MATSVDSVNDSSDYVKDYSCVACESKNIELCADFFCETCLKCFCQTCLYHHDQMFVNHVTYGRGESNKWPLTKTTEDLLLKCDVHNSETLKMFCQDHSQLCCSDCLLVNHRQCKNVALISESAKNPSVDIQQLSNKIQIILADLNKFKRSQEASIHFVEGSYSEKLQEIREVRKKLNADLDGLENSTLKELDTIRSTLQTSLKKDVDNCSRLKDELQQLSEAVQGLCDKSKKDIEFIASRKCLDKILESESYLKENSVKVQSSIIFKANIDLTST